MLFDKGEGTSFYVVCFGAGHSLIAMTLRREESSGLKTVFLINPFSARVVYQDFQGHGFDHQLIEGILESHRHCLGANPLVKVLGASESDAKVYRVVGVVEKVQYSFTQEFPGVSIFDSPIATVRRIDSSRQPILNLGTLEFLGSGCQASTLGVSKHLEVWV